MQVRIKLAMRVVGLVIVLCSLLAVGAYAFIQISPWPMALYMRQKWDRGGAEMNRAIERFVPNNVSSRLNLQYDVEDRDVRLDVYFPSSIEQTDRVLPVVVWVHGGSWISGSKDYVANYLKILASKGFTVVGLDYSLAPAKHYPTPVKQLNVALSFVEEHSKELHADSSRIFLAGSSAGAQIAAQLANVITSPSYAAEVGIKAAIDPSRLKGAVFHCGTYDAKLAHFRRKGVLWAYFGTKEFFNDPRLSQFSVAGRVTPSFPPTFVSTGNADSFASQSYLLAANLAEQGVYVDRLFFPQDYVPKVWHEFQFGLDTAAGQLALDRSVQFMVEQLNRSSAQVLTKGKANAD